MIALSLSPIVLGCSRDAGKTSEPDVTSLVTAPASFAEMLGQAKRVPTSSDESNALVVTAGSARIAVANSLSGGVTATDESGSATTFRPVGADAQAVTVDGTAVFSDTLTGVDTGIQIVDPHAFRIFFYSNWSGT